LTYNWQKYIFKVIYDEILFSLLKVGNFAICNSINEPGGN
jgi:hypothetical protein